ncbi:hypothetical protein RI103_06400 [Paraburkholderia sp. FT54]|uniref:hypothetical protein n=1 Tax=Paraburkholderia sp. FT54 TaxID=3074437 RepID=UPI0028781552|nr:hypothetical protein [Paraburkholderia sp. FT54]WNC90978.1 hypothetical protein RI103_06400 [Paraburkholderia sp. FT54]
MKTIIIRAVLLASVVGLSACGVGYRNGKQCEARMLETYPTQEPAITVKRTAVSHNGIRVVVEATYEVELKAKPKTLLTTKTYSESAAVECVFDNETMTGFKWVSPKKMEAKADTTAAETRGD